MDEFEDVDCVAHLPMTPMDEGRRHARQRAAMARMMSRIYRVANDRLRADMLMHLVRPLGLLGLVAVASGAFARLVWRDGLVPDTIAAEDIVRYSSEQIRELTLFVCDVDPDALQPFVEQLAQNGIGMAALSTAALVMLHRSSRRRSRQSGKTVSAVETNDDQRRLGGR
jgi:hypothetical protein